jgi:hypothetical protein
VLLSLRSLLWGHSTPTPTPTDDASPYRSQGFGNWVHRGRTQYEDGKPVRPRKRRIKREDVTALPEPVVAQVQAPAKPVAPRVRPSPVVAPAVPEPEPATAADVLDTPNYPLLAWQKARDEEADDEEAMLASIETLLRYL